MLLAFDQYGNHYWLKTKYPRKELTEIFGAKHIDKMYRDTKNGPRHVGYIIRGHWLEILNVTPWKV